MDALTIGQESPLGDDLSELFERHAAHCHMDTPPESMHMMDRFALGGPGISFYVMRDQGRAVGMGAVKVIAPGHGEIKSMHVLSEMRGRGLAAKMVTHLIEAARAGGLTRLSLETGSQASFIPAQLLYAAAGFVECGPFGSYRTDPNSTFMTREI